MLLDAQCSSFLRSIEFYEVGRGGIRLNFVVRLIVLGDGQAIVMPMVVFVW